MELGQMFMVVSVTILFIVVLVINHMDNKTKTEH